MADLFIPVHLGLERHSGIEGKDETDRVGLALQALEHRTKEGRGRLG